VRLRLRRLNAADGGGWAVVAVEDLTAEVQTARVLAWGEMARQVAHEIKNPLTPIKLAVQHVRRAFFDKRPDFGEILERNVAAILREIDRLGEISRAFSRFGTPAGKSVELEQVDVRRAIEETLALYGGGDGGPVFRTEIQPGALPPVIARADELKEVLVNLLENAREAVGGGGEIVVSAFEERLGPADGELRSSSARVSVAVSDTGLGIPEDQLARIFEPHFSTRSSGTGLGLAIVRRIADSWGAEVRVDSTVGKGTRIELLLREANGAEPDVET
jgi:nitrogen fixation/metabolism regulation signal transduction histidine kinase